MVKIRKTQSSGIHLYTNDENATSRGSSTDVEMSLDFLANYIMQHLLPL